VEKKIFWRRQTTALSARLVILPERDHTPEQALVRCGRHGEILACHYHLTNVQQQVARQCSGAVLVEKVVLATLRNLVIDQRK
jgi:hypothetical protein